jgi:ubiquitin-like protein Pup
MSHAKQLGKKPSSPASEERAGRAPAAKVAGGGARLREEVDRIVDEIDSVLEENASEFVKGYVQRGGE